MTFDFLPEATTTFDFSVRSNNIRFSADVTTTFDSSAEATTLGFLLIQQRHLIVLLMQQ